MKNLVRALSTLLVLVLLGVTVIYFLAEPLLTEQFSSPGKPVAIPDNPSPEMLARGEKLSRTLGCYTGCHGERMEGRVMLEEPDFSRVVAPNVGAALLSYSDDEFERIVRHGIRPDGTGVAIMPSSTFHALADDDYVALVAYLKTLPVDDSEFVGRSFRLGPVFRLMLYRGEVALEPAQTPDGIPPDRAPNSADQLALGKYLVQTSCPECHGLDLHGLSIGGDVVPDLIIASGYTRSQFGTLLMEGVSADGRSDLGLMTEIARARGAFYEEADIDAIHAFLVTLAEDEAHLAGMD